MIASSGETTTRIYRKYFDTASCTVDRCRLDYIGLSQPPKLPDSDIQPVSLC